MLLLKVLRQVVQAVQPIVRKVEVRMKAWTKPTSDSFIGGTAADLMKSKPELIVENAFLRQQLIIVTRHTKQPNLTPRDRGLLVVLTSRVQERKNTLLIVKPDTLLKWHRQGFKLFWRQKSKAQLRQPRFSAETIVLIKQMAIDNRRWGAKRIRGELLKPEIRVNKGTIRHYMWQARRQLPPQHYGQSWATFLANHAAEIWACDFVQTNDLFFRGCFSSIIEHGSRRVVHAGVTRNPTDEWVGQ